MMTITIQNVGEDTPGLFTYRVEVLVNGRRIDQLIVKGHDRADGWPRLLEQIAEAKRERRLIEMVQMIDEVGK